MLDSLHLKHVGPAAEIRLEFAPRLADWASWIREGGKNADQMATALRHLTGDEGLSPGPLARLSVDDVRDIPSINTAYAPVVPALHASSGIRRMLGLAYMPIWSWNEHTLAATQLGEEPTGQLVLIFDEIESHLHPRWQRTILQSLLTIAEALHEKAQVQLLTATHSPLILASAEPLFVEEEDAWFDIDLRGGQVELVPRKFVRDGDVSNWLTSLELGVPLATTAPARHPNGEARC